MFADNIPALRVLVEQRKRVIHQMNLDRRRWGVRRDILVAAQDTFLPALEAAIARSHTDWGQSVVLRTYTNDEWEWEDADRISLGEVFRKTDVLARVANCLAPGFFKCHVRSTTVRQPAERVRVYEVIARFYAGGVEAEKPPCTCVCAYLTEGFCDVCGGHNVRALNPHPQSVADAAVWREGDDWTCASCNRLHEQPVQNCFNCGLPRQAKQINNPEDEDDGAQ